jgi:hypothetical protein
MIVLVTDQNVFSRPWNWPQAPLGGSGVGRESNRKADLLTHEDGASVTTSVCELAGARGKGRLMALIERQRGGVQTAASVGIHKGLPFTLTLIVIGLFIPEELSFYVFGLRLTVVRLLFLLLTPVLIFKASQKLSAGRYRFVLSDVVVVAIGFWFIYAPSNVDGLQLALNHAGPMLLEFCVGYFTTRLMLANSAAALSFAELLCRSIAVVAWVGALDTLTSHRFVHDLAAELTAPMHNVDNWSDAYRWGLFRATGPIEHPILYGFICAIGLLIALSIPMRGRVIVILSCGLGMMLSFSAAPIQVMVMGIGLLAYNRALSSFSYRWLLLIGVAVITVLATFTINQNPLGFIISNLTFSPETGYFREWTWASVMTYVSQSPWFGLGFGELPDELNHSIDSLWLVLSIQFGYPGAIIVAVALLTAGPFRRAGKLAPRETSLAVVLGIALFLTFFMGFTVHMWGTTWVLSGLLLGLKAQLTEFSYLANVASEDDRLGQQKRDEIKLNRFGIPKSARF